MLSHRSFVIAAVAVIAVAGAVAAQSPPVDVEVIVTASRIEESAEDAPASVSVVTAEQLVASGQPTLVDALEQVAGVYFRSTTGGPAQAEVSMGGFGDGSVTRVLVLVDGRRVNRPDIAGTNWLQVPVENVERVEVVRGSASVLYGDHAIGGVINIITKKGSEKLSVTASAMGGSFVFNQERLGITGPAGPVRFAANGERTASDGYRDRSAWSSLGGGVDLDAALSSAVAASLRLGYNQTDYELPGALSEAQWKDDPTQAVNPADEARDRTVTADAGVKAALGDALELRGNLAWALTSVETDFVSFASYSDVVIQSVSATPRATLSTEIGNRSLTVITGLDASWDGLNRLGYADKGRDTRTADADVSRGSLGAYATASWTLSDPLTLEVGGRYEAAGVTARASLGSTLDDSKLLQGWAANASVLYRPAETVRAHLRLDRVYRYPALDEQSSYYNSVFGPDAFYSDLEPEYGYSADAGLDLELLPGLRLSGGASVLEMNDEIAYYDPDGFGGVPGANVNQDQTQHLGARAQASWTRGPLVLSGNYAWQLTTFQAGADEGHEVPLVPNHEVLLEARVKLPFDLAAAANGRYVSESYQGGDNANAADKVPQYVVVAASLAWKPRFVRGNLELFAGVENLFDEKYVSYIYFDGYYPAPGRNWRVGGFYKY
jgi:iron complex outermembrane recepter protein